MIGYSEVIQTMAAMIIFSMILINANYMIQRNSIMQIDAELEQEVISLGQEIIEEARAKAFDEVTQGEMPPTIIPGGFTPTSAFPTEEEQQLAIRSNFLAFEDFHNWSEVITTPHGDFHISVEVYYVDDINFERVEAQTTFKKIDVTVRSEFLRGINEPRNYQLEFIRNYYAE
ncbi:hypothetical protein [Rhodohalobacter sp. SW132]|uniref:hypothetical protein n=1 Tax=Rhodohalobacter sp. SW132 TaxID=2293433 RepID=UPI000E22002F|nr:hypothetical protein [Rhodohalobacter sp. SW132]